MMRFFFLSFCLFCGSLVSVFAEQMAPGLTLSDDQLRQKMDSRWQPVRQFVLTNSQKKMMYDRFSLLVEGLEKEEKKQYIFGSIRGGSGSGVVMTGSALSGDMLSGSMLSGQVLSGTVPPGTQFLGTASSGDMLSGVVLSGQVLSGATVSGSVLSGTIVYRYVPRYRVCDSLLSLDEAVGAMVYKIRRDIIGSSNPKMKQELMIKGEILAFLHTMIKEYAEEKQLFVSMISEGGAAAREYRVCK